jgi:hypothetical protein
MRFVSTFSQFSVHSGFTGVTMPDSDGQHSDRLSIPSNCLQGKSKWKHC